MCFENVTDGETEYEPKPWLPFFRPFQHHRMSHREKHQARIEACENKVAKLKAALVRIAEFEAELKKDAPEWLNQVTSRRFIALIDTFGDVDAIQERINRAEKRLASLRSQITTSVADAARANTVNPSDFGAPARFRLTQERMNYPIYLHRPFTATGVPVSIFCPVFADFQQACETIDVDASDMENALNLMAAMSNFYNTENERENAARRIFQVPLLFLRLLLTMQRYFPVFKEDIDGYRTDGVVGKHDRFYAIFEYKNELCGIKSCPILQLSRYYQAHVGKIRNEKSHLPCFLIAIAGPHLLVFGAVQAHRILMDPLASAMLYFQTQDPKPSIKVARMLRALKDAIASIEAVHRNEYKDIKYPPCWSIKRPRLADLAHNNTVMENASADIGSAESITTPETVDLTLIEGMEEEGDQASGEESISFRYTAPIGLKSLYRVVSDDDHKTKMILKMTAHYDIAIHHFSAQHGFAPKIIGYEKPGVNGFHTILMESMSDEFVLYAELAPQGDYKNRVLGELKRVLELLHDANLVHGDCRPSNVMYRIDREGAANVMLIDFEFSGKEGVGVYPMTMNPDVGMWHPDAKAGAPLHRDHDMHGLAAMMRFEGQYDYQKPAEDFEPMLKILEGEESNCPNSRPDSDETNTDETEEVRGTASRRKAKRSRSES